MLQSPASNTPCAVNLPKPLRGPVQVAVYFEAADADVGEFVEAGVSPFGVVEIVVENGVAEEEAIGGVVFGHVPVAAADEVVLMDDLVIERRGVGFIEPG